MGLWPGDEYFGHRYDYAAEYVQILRELWETGRSDFKGEFFQMEDCRLSPRPQVPMKIICAGQSDAGLAFTAQYADYNFCFGKGVNTPTAFAPTVSRLKQADAPRPAATSRLRPVHDHRRRDRRGGRAKWELYKAGADQEALRLADAAGRRRQQVRRADTNVRQMADPESAVNINMGTLVGSYATVARHAGRDRRPSRPARACC